MKDHDIDSLMKMFSKWIQEFSSKMSACSFVKTHRFILSIVAIKYFNVNAKVKNKF